MIFILNNFDYSLILHNRCARPQMRPCKMHIILCDNNHVRTLNAGINKYQAIEPIIRRESKRNSTLMGQKVSGTAYITVLIVDKTILILMFAFVCNFRWFCCAVRCKGKIHMLVELLSLECVLLHCFLVSKGQRIFLSEYY